uniref:Putative secreted protein n=1 Tax=Anopheles darlingi TaxID=43151 RepID=A0A2M4DLR9_ANODA
MMMMVMMMVMGMVASIRCPLTLKVFVCCVRSLSFPSGPSSFDGVRDEVSPLLLPFCVLTELAGRLS